MTAKTRSLALLVAALACQSAFAAGEAVSKEVKHQTVQALCQALKDRYVDPAAAKKMEAALTKAEAEGAFDSLEEGQAFATKLADICHGLVTDAHLRIRYSEQPLPVRKDAGQPSRDEVKRFEEGTRFMNSSWQKVERLPGNLGYFAFNGFQDPKHIERPLAAAMAFLADTDAMIIDLRTNGGGDPEGVKAVCSYFFGDKPVHLNNIYFRNGEKMDKQEFWTSPKIQGKRYLDKEVYVLVSKRTGSGAEECAYDLQNLKRATIIGENTWGGANPGGTVRLNDHFSAFVPVGRAENPYTKTNWEGTGVTPTIKSDPKEALKLAQILALETLIKKSQNADFKDAYERALKDLKGA